MAEVVVAVIIVVMAGVTVATQVDVTVVNCVEVPAVWTAGIVITELGADVVTEAVVMTGVIVTRAGIAITAAFAVVELMMPVVTGAD